MPDKNTEALLDALLGLPGMEDRATRTALLRGIKVPLNRSDHAFVDLTNIIEQLERLGRLANGEWPVAILAHNAGMMVRGTELATKLKDIEEGLAKAYAEDTPLAELPDTPEALIFGGEGEWVTLAFLTEAKRVGESVGRIRVPRIVNGTEEHPVGALGTGWLIGPRMLLTNHHVINAREMGERPASVADFDAQAMRSVVWFDYYVEGRESVEVKVTRALRNNALLDYALLELGDEPAVAKRGPVALPQSAPSLDRGTRLNVVQCPSGGPLRFAIRNNFYVGRGSPDHKIRYLTDTLPGSSGSPVMTDTWSVVALHQGARMVDPKAVRPEPGVDKNVVKFHNQGIDIQTIIADIPADIAADIKKAHGWT